MQRQGRPRRPRREAAAAVRRLREDGLGWPEVADRLRLSVSTVRAYHYDPDGAGDRERKKGYAGWCESCGSPTSGAQGPGRAPRRCRRCADAPSWPPDRITEALRRARDRLGRTPTVYDLAPALARRRGLPAPLTTRERGRWPSASTVARRFGSFPAAVRAAGLEPAQGGVRRWPPAAIVAALRRDSAARGRHPRAREWMRSSPERPCASTVISAFGSWSEALRAADLG